MWISTDAGRNRPEAYDCTVRALALAPGWDYPRAHDYLKQHGRKDNRRFNMGKAFAAYGKLYKRADRRLSSPTVRFWLSHHPQGRFMVWVEGHVFHVYNGTIYDDVKPRLLQRVKAVWSLPSHVKENTAASC